MQPLEKQVKNFQCGVLLYLYNTRLTKSSRQVISACRVECERQL